MVLNNINNIFNINNEYTRLLTYTVFAAVIINVIGILINYINKKIHLNEKQMYIANKKMRAILSISFIIILIITWKNPLKHTITIISFISAAITLAARDIIFNYFCGIYIKLTKPIKIEDRIEINGYTGDIININNLNFELLEVDSKTNQSTGIILHLPNSLIFNNALKNYNKAFKYIWDELTIRVPIGTDLDLAQTILLKIVNSNLVVKEIPKKMKKEIEQSISKYRIYYNNLNPITYIQLKDEYVYITIRFLIHPKKKRNVESEIYTNILKTFKQKGIDLK